MYFAKLYPDHVKKVVTLDNLRVPFVTGGRFKILSFRSKDPHFKTDPGVIPPEDVRKKSGIEVVQTGFQHNDMRDTGPTRRRHRSKECSKNSWKMTAISSRSRQKCRQR